MPPAWGLVCAVINLQLFPPIFRPPYSNIQISLPYPDLFFFLSFFYSYFFCVPRPTHSLDNLSHIHEQLTAVRPVAQTHTMADTATTNDADAAAQRAAEQARLRKERREAKIKAGGSARLEKITGVGGRVTGGP